MNNFFLKRYLKNITKEDIYTLAINHNIILKPNEIQKVYDYIKNNYQEYINHNLTNEEILKNSKQILSNTNYNKLVNLYNEYKDKI